MHIFENGNSTYILLLVLIENNKQKLIVSDTLSVLLCSKYDSTKEQVLYYTSILYNNIIPRYT